MGFEISVQMSRVRNLLQTVVSHFHSIHCTCRLTTSPSSTPAVGKYAALEHKTSDLPGPAISREILPTPKVSPLHCRICRKDPCIDTTATMCGHIFCSRYSHLDEYNCYASVLICVRCITDEIVSTSKCPVCSTTTLLYCLFRIDLSR